MEKSFTNAHLDRELIVALREGNFDFKVTEFSGKKPSTVYEVNHLKILISSEGLAVDGQGIKERYKAIDFRVRPGLGKEVVMEILSFLAQPDKRSMPLWRQWFSLIFK